MIQLTGEQVAFFETFGYLSLPGALAGDLEWITAEFEAVFRDRGIEHDGVRRSCIVPFIDHWPGEPVGSRTRRQVSRMARHPEGAEERHAGKCTRRAAHRSLR
jgi:hypothetical protein